MKVTATSLPEVLLIEPKVFGDARGYFLESWNQRSFSAAGVDATFVQDNQSRSARNVLRGLHYQIEQPQGKLVRVIAGCIFDVVVDIRRSSPNFGKWAGTYLSADKHQSLWVPIGFAHGFCVASDNAEVTYKTTDYYAPAHERAILWSDPAIGIEWPVSAGPIISAKDAAAPLLANAQVFP